MARKAAEVANLIENPSAHFPSPDTVLKDRRLSPDDKKAALAQWEQDARLLAVATEEGMGGGEPARLDEVKQAQARLPGDIPPSPSPAKSG